MWIDGPPSREQIEARLGHDGRHDQFPRFVRVGRGKQGNQLAVEYVFLRLFTGLPKSRIQHHNRRAEEHQQQQTDGKQESRTE